MATSFADAAIRLEAVILSSEFNHLGDFAASFPRTLTEMFQ